MEFTIRGQRYSLTIDDVTAVADALPPERMQQLGVEVSGRVFPVKQILEAASGLSRSAFTSHEARRVLARLGLPLIGEPRLREPSSVRTATHHSAAQARHDLARNPTARSWSWEGSVQDTFVEGITKHGWKVISTADTARRGRGVDVVAEKGPRRLGAEVKGWPSKEYSDPRRSHESKPTQPSTQAGHWFAQALMKAVMLLDSSPDSESLIVLPDYSRYRDLAQRTRRGRGSANIHVVLIDGAGAFHSDTWTP